MGLVEEDGERVVWPRGEGCLREAVMESRAELFPMAPGRRPAHPCLQVGSRELQKQGETLPHAQWRAGIIGTESRGSRWQVDKWAVEVSGELGMGGPVAMSG